MQNAINCNKYIFVANGIHEIITELLTKFNFDEFLFPKRFTVVFITFCIGIILFNNSKAIYIAQKLFWVSHDALLTRLLPKVLPVTISGTKFLITDLPRIAAQDMVKKYLYRWDIEVFFRDIKQYLNFEKVQVYSLDKLEGYFSLVFISF